MQSISTQFETELQKRVGEERERIRDILEIGSAVPDYATYLRYVGQCYALNRVSGEFCDDVNIVINKR